MLASSFFIRQLLAAARRPFERAPERAQGWPSFFDNTDGIGSVKRVLFYKDKKTGVMLPYKGYAAPVQPKTKVGIEAHITAVPFGTTKSARAFWKKLILAGTLGDDIIGHYAVGFDPAQSDYLDKVAERMALHQRFWEVPYHWIALLNGDVLHNNQITRYTFHGNGGNGPLVGVSLEGNFPGLEKNRTKKHNGYDAHTIETGRAALRLGTTDSRSKGAPIAALYAHRQYDDGRIGDPGEGFWKEIGIPISQELGLERRVAFRHGTGTPICREWDELGPVDYRGKKLAA